MFESTRHPPAPRRVYLWRLLVHALLALALIGASLLLGMLGYVGFEHLEWIDAFLNAAMLLGGMGPIHSPLSTAGKLFAGCYALYAGLMFIAVAGVMLAPVLHRVLHRFHWDSR